MSISPICVFQSRKLWLTPLSTEGKSVDGSKLPVTDPSVPGGSNFCTSWDVCVLGIGYTVRYFGGSELILGGCLQLRLEICITFVSTEQRSGCLCVWHPVCKIAVFGTWQVVSDILSQMVLKCYALENLPS